MVLYVDDIMITSKDRDKIMNVYNHLVNTFKEVTINESKVCSYLGMTFDFATRRTVRVTMNAYVNDTLKEFGVESTSVTPASEHLFEIRESPPLTKDNANLFHTWTAKLLYLSKRTRPDILTAISFLTTRVLEPTEDDWAKLERVMKYLNGTKDMGITLDASSDKPLELQAWIDASFAPHEDAKSHTGLIIALGNGPVFASSTKQKLVSKSSTELELIGISDSLSQVIWSREFMISQGYEMSATKVHQDNQSTIMIKNGKGSSKKTRHVNIRYFWIKERVETGEVDISYLQSLDMVADILTKPLQGELFRKLRGRLLNWQV